MRIGHQLFEFLRYCTDTGSYSVQETESFMDVEGRRLCIKEMYINEEENQVYLVILAEKAIFLYLKAVRGIEENQGYG